MAYLEIKFIRDLKSMRKILSRGEYITYKIKSGLIMQMLKAKYSKKEIIEIEQGFKLKGEGNIEKVESEKVKLEEFLLGSKLDSSELKQLSNSRFFILLKRKIKAFNIKLFNKAAKNNNVLGMFMLMGINVSWKIKA